MDHIDHTSVRLATLTIILQIFTAATLSIVALCVTILAGLTTVVYNIVKTIKETKK